jgi:hypothetical protein
MKRSPQFLALALALPFLPSTAWASYIAGEGTFILLCFAAIFVAISTPILLVLCAFKAFKSTAIAAVYSSILAIGAALILYVASQDVKSSDFVIATAITLLLYAVAVAPVVGQCLYFRLKLRAKLRASAKQQSATWAAIVASKQSRQKA